VPDAARLTGSPTVLLVLSVELIQSHTSDTIIRRPEEYRDMPKISVEVPQELLDDLDDHVGSDGKFVNRSEAIRASVRKTLDMLDEIDERHGRLDQSDPPESDS
jgi:Arc/MetJ-type ribon-helix-helix transcriptional regulator